MLRSTSDWPGWYGLQPHLLQKNEMHFCQLLMAGGQWTQTPSTTPLQPKKWNAHFWIMFNFWWLARLVDGLKPHLPPLSSQKNEMLIFDDYNQPHLISRPKTEMLNRLEPHPWTTTSPAKKWNAHFWIMLNFWWLPGWLMDSNPIHHPSPAKKMKCSFLDYVQLQPIKWNADYVLDGLEPHPPPLSSQKNEMLIFV